jgi:hypothetical protein
VGRSLGVGVGRGVTIGVTVGVAEGVAVGVAVAVGVGVGDPAPPFAVQRIVPASPTAIPRSASLAKETWLRLAEVPLVWSVQAIPIFVVCKIRPAQPTANPTLVVFVTGKSTPSIG